MAASKVNRPPVMVDVARLAGVSHQTVSRVLNGYPNVSESARSRVESAIEQLGYRRNSTARALVTRRSMTLGVVSVDTVHHGPSRTLFGIAEAARQSGYSVNLVILDRIDEQTMAGALNHLVEASVDGIVVIAPVVEAVSAVAGLAADVPLVMVEGMENEQTGAVAIDDVAIDQELGARLAVRHLLELGHRTVWHVKGPPGWLEADARIEGWRKELADAGLPAHGLIPGDWSPESGHRAGQELLRHTSSGAVFVANDQMALGLLQAMHEAGVEVPGAFSVVGFDDVPEAGFYLPPLTTVRQDFAEVGRRCIARLLSLIDGQTPPEMAPLEPTLVVRSSTGPPPRA